jgi:hypothetical protein
MGERLDARPRRVRLDALHGLKVRGFVDLCPGGLR